VKEKAPKVFVGMSGGVDSSVSAALLKEQGYDVTGVFIKVWQPDFYECTWREDRLDAMRVCALLDIPCMTLDLEKEYKREVVDYMIEEYKAGRTPNPDVMCNKHVKFGGFFTWSREHGADYVATGHYAQIKNRKGIYELHTAKDAAKDQTYFLWTLDHEHLRHTLFPIGHLTKSRVRKLAKKFKLPNAEKKDSQGLCFIGKVDMKEFLRHYVPEKPGTVVDTSGRVIGSHRGAAFFTLGERHGFTITERTSSDDRLYVVDKDMEHNTITVSKMPFTDPRGQTVIAVPEPHWISTPPKSSDKIHARIRYRQPLEECSLEIHNDTLSITFRRPQFAPTPGQSVVLYKGPVCLGGGSLARQPSPKNSPMI